MLLMVGKGRILLAIVAVLFALGCAQLQSQFPAQPPMQNTTPPAQPSPQPPAPPPNITNMTNTSEPAPPNETPPIASQNISNQTNASNLSEVPVGLEFGNYSLVLEDLLLQAGPDRVSCASLAIYDAVNATRLDRLVACPRENAYWIAPDGHRFRIVVYQTAPGYTNSEKWAQLAVFG